MCFFHLQICVEVNLQPISAPHRSDHEVPGENLLLDVHSWNEGLHSQRPPPTESLVTPGSPVSVNTMVNGKCSPDISVQQTSNHLQDRLLSPHLDTNQTGQLNLQNELSNLDELGPYEPELSRCENPHYFAANEVLYHAHVQRKRRLDPRSDYR